MSDNGAGIILEKKKLEFFELRDGACDIRLAIRLHRLGFFKFFLGKHHLVFCC